MVQTRMWVTGKRVNPGKHVDLSGSMGQMINVCEHAQGCYGASCMLAGVPRFA